MSEFRHTPIMVEEVVSLLKPERGGTFIDGTLGGGGHAMAILERLQGSGRLIGIDRDREAIEAANRRLAGFGGRFEAIRGNFFDMKRILRERGVESADGILLDLGVSSHQLDTAERGFSYGADAPLDMRMDPDAGFSAYDVVNGYPLERLVEVIRDYGEERYARRVAARIVEARGEGPITGTLELAEIIRRAMPPAARREPQHPARRTFQALRIEVNGELDGLERALIDAEGLLKPSGVLAVLTFHSLEDRIVKRAFRTFEHPCTCDPKAPVCTCGKTPTSRVLTPRPVTPSGAEVEKNPRAHSAKLRAIEKLAAFITLEGSE